MGSMIDISVIIPTFNRPRLLDRALRSVEKQIYKPVEVLVIDDGSNDEEALANQAVVAKYKRSGLNVMYIYQHKLGAPEARNKGIRIAKGEWLAFLDDDDEWLPNRLFLQTRLALEVPEEVGLIYGWAEVYDKESGTFFSELRPEIEGSVLKEILKNNFVPSPTVLVRKNCFEEVGLFDPAFPSCQDWEMWVRVACKFEFRVIKAIIARYYFSRTGREISIGTSEKALYGYYLFFSKYENLFFQNGMQREFSTGLSWIGYKLSQLGDERAKECFKRSFKNYFSFKMLFRMFLGYFFLLLKKLL